MSSLKSVIMLLLILWGVSLAACGATIKSTATPWHKAPMENGLPWDAYHAP